MKESYTLTELLESCGVSLPVYQRPRMEWDMMTLKDMIDYYYGNNHSPEMMDAMELLNDIAYLRGTKETTDIPLGEVWYDEDEFPISLEEFEDTMYNSLLDYFEMYTYLSYAITEIVFTEEYNEELQFNGYRVVAYGNMVTSYTWTYHLKKIHKQFFT